MSNGKKSNLKKADNGNDNVELSEEDKVLFANTFANRQSNVKKRKLINAGRGKGRPTNAKKKEKVKINSKLFIREFISED